jgi:hypothetical protein
LITSSAAKSRPYADRLPARICAVRIREEGRTDPQAARGMTEDKDQKIVRDQRGEEQPKDKERTETPHRTRRKKNRARNSSPHRFRNESAWLPNDR